MARPIAYSYARFSTPEQERGDSERRQIESDRQYAEQQGFVLDESIVVDRGVSAFAGKNVSEGALGEFIKRVERKKIARGSALFVESPDRVSRQPFSECWPSYQRILSGGMEIHFLSIGRVLKPNHTFVDVLQIGVEIDRGNSESQMKSQRLGAVWGQKKHHSPAGMAITNKLPGWLDGKTGGLMTINTAKAKVVQRIFEMAASGIGKRLIARRLNEEKVPTFGRAATWGQSYIQKILFNRATLGEYQPHKGRPGHRQPEGALRPAFYPTAITAELWDRAHKSIATRVIITAHGKVTGKFAGRTGALRNLFTGLVWDANEGLPMHYGDKGKRARPRLSTNSKDVNGATPNSVIYDEFERAFLSWLDALDWSTVIDVADTKAIKRTEEEIAELQLSITRSEAQIQILVDALVTLSAPAAALNDRLLKLESQVKTDKAQLENSQAQLIEAKNKNRDFTDQAIVFAALSTTKDLATRARLRQEIRRKVARIDFWFHRDKNTPYLVKNWKNDLFPFARITFTNGQQRHIVLVENGFMTLSM